MVYPGSWFFPSRISDHGNTKREKGKKLGVLPFFVAINFIKFKIIKFLNRQKKHLTKNLRMFQEVKKSPFFKKYGSS
jgi:hypothetical protein